MKAVVGCALLVSAAKNQQQSVSEMTRRLWTAAPLKILTHSAEVEGVTSWQFIEGLLTMNLEISIEAVEDGHATYPVPNVDYSKLLLVLESSEREATHSESILIEISNGNTTLKQGMVSNSLLSTIQTDRAIPIEFSNAGLSTVTRY